MTRSALLKDQMSVKLEGQLSTPTGTSVKGYKTL